MNSRTRTPTRDLARIPSEKCRNFLLQAANLRKDCAAMDRFMNRFGNVVPEILPPPNEGFLNLIDQTYIRTLALKSALQEIWRGPDLRTREWGVFRLLEHSVDGWSISLPPLTPIEQIANYLRGRLHRLKICPNKDCVAPYFFAVRSSQVYCSDICALPFQREYKRQWWAKHGAAWRRKRSTA